MYFINFIRNFMSKEEGQTLSEYALILVLIAVVAIGAVTLLGTQIVAVLTNIANNLQGEKKESNQPIHYIFKWTNSNGICSHTPIGSTSCHSSIRIIW